MRRVRRSQNSPPASGLSPAKSGAHSSILALAEDSLECADVAPRTAAPEDGLTTALSIDSTGRADVLDLDRAFFMGDGGTVDVSWLGLPPTGRNESYRLLLQVAVTTPVDCLFVVGVPLDAEDAAHTLRTLGYLLAADRLALAFDAPVAAGSVILMAAPIDKRALLAAIDSLRDVVGVELSARARG
jgi:hypothetical protein